MSLFLLLDLNYKIKLRVTVAEFLKSWPNEKLSTSRETTMNLGFFGAVKSKVQNDAKDKRKQREEREEKTTQPVVLC